MVPALLFGVVRRDQEFRDLIYGGSGVVGTHYRPRSRWEEVTILEPVRHVNEAARDARDAKEPHPRAAKQVRILTAANGI